MDVNERFAFGKNWQHFLTVVDDDRINAAERSLKDLLGMDTLQGKNFLDIGSGSGLFSLAAMRLGADRVVSFDDDEASVACTRELKERFCPAAGDWTIETGSVLDSGYLASLGVFDVVYSWGVLHHTGEMWRALRNVETSVAPGGQLAISIYNDQGYLSSLWTGIKRLYGMTPSHLRTAYVIAVMAPRELRFLLVSTVKLHPWRYFRTWHAHDQGRGMSRWHNMVDWVGGYPFEVAKPEEIFGFFSNRGFVLQQLKTSGGEIGCNEFVFRRDETVCQTTGESQTRDNDSRPGAGFLSRRE